MKIAVYMRTYAHYVSEVELTDEELERIAAEYDVTVNELDADMIRDLAEDKAFTRGVPGLCYQEQIYIGDWESPDKTEDSVEIIER